MHAETAMPSARSRGRGFLTCDVCLGDRVSRTNGQRPPSWLGCDDSAAPARTCRSDSWLPRRFARLRRCLPPRVASTPRGARWPAPALFTTYRRPRRRSRSVTAAPMSVGFGHIGTAARRAPAASSDRQCASARRGRATTATRPASSGRGRHRPSPSAPHEGANLSTPPRTASLPLEPWGTSSRRCRGRSWELTWRSFHLPGVTCRPRRQTERMT